MPHDSHGDRSGIAISMPPCTNKAASPKRTVAKAVAMNRTIRPLCDWHPRCQPFFVIPQTYMRRGRAAGRIFAAWFQAARRASQEQAAADTDSTVTLQPNAYRRITYTAIHRARRETSSQGAPPASEPVAQRQPEAVAPQPRPRRGEIERQRLPAPVPPDDPAPAFPGLDQAEIRITPGEFERRVVRPEMSRFQPSASRRG